MSLNSVILAVEDSLSDAVSTKILKHFGIEIVQRIPNTYQGKSYLQRRANELNRSAPGPPYAFMFTDLDSPGACVSELIQSWVKAPLNPGFFPSRGGDGNRIVDYGGSACFSDVFVYTS